MRRTVVFLSFIAIIVLITSSIAEADKGGKPHRTTTTTTTTSSTSTTASSTSTTSSTTTTTTTTLAPTTTTTVASTTTTAATTTTTTVPSNSWGCFVNPASGGAYGPDGTRMELNNDVFAPVQPFSSTICGNNLSFYADVSAGNCGGCVQSYPSIKYRYDQSSWVGCCGEPGGSIPLPLVSAWTSAWNVDFPSDTNSQAAYDLWFANNCGALGGHDAMIWVDTTASRGTGGGPITGHPTIDGRQITLMQYGTPGVSVSETIFKFDTNEPSGSVNLMAFVNALVSLGDLRACDSQGIMINNADFGFEVAQTNGVQRFSVPSFGFDVLTTDGVHHY